MIEIILMMIILYFLSGKKYRQIYREMFKIYMPTYLHLTPYLVGIVTGYILVVNKSKNLQFPKVCSHFKVEIFDVNNCFFC